jgi:hypothetical protein
VVSLDLRIKFHEVIRFGRPVALMEPLIVTTTTIVLSSSAVSTASEGFIHG